MTVTHTSLAVGPRLDETALKMTDGRRVTIIDDCGSKNSVNDDSCQQTSPVDLKANNLSLKIDVELHPAN